MKKIIAVICFILIWPYFSTFADGRSTNDVNKDIFRKTETNRDGAQLNRKYRTSKNNGSVYHERYENGKLLWRKSGAINKREKYVFYDKNGKMVKEYFNDQSATKIDGKDYCRIVDLEKVVTLARYNRKFIAASKEINEKYGLNREISENNDLIVLNTNGEIIFCLKNTDLRFECVNGNLDRFVLIKETILNEGRDKPGVVSIYDRKENKIFCKEMLFNKVCISPSGNWLIVRGGENEKIYAFDVINGITYVFKNAYVNFNEVDDRGRLISDDGNIVENPKSKT